MALSAGLSAHPASPSTALHPTPARHPSTPFARLMPQSANSTFQHSVNLAEQKPRASLRLNALDPHRHHHPPLPTALLRRDTHADTPGSFQASPQACIHKVPETNPQTSTGVCDWKTRHFYQAIDPSHSTHAAALPDALSKIRYLLSAHKDSPAMLSIGPNIPESH